MSTSLSSAQANILKYVPDIILDEFIKRGANKIAPPEIISCRALLLTANILQFSRLTQNLLKSSHDGIELVTEVHSIFMNMLQEYLGKTGGDVFKYSTDKVYFYWAVSPNNVEEYLADLSRSIVFQLLNLKEAMKVRLKLKGIVIRASFTLTMGDFNLVHLGGFQNQIEYVCGGNCVLQAIEHIVPESGDDFDKADRSEFYLVVNNGIYEKLKNDFNMEPAEYFEDSKPTLTTFFNVNGVNKSPDSFPNIDPLYFKKDITLTQFEAIQHKLYNYLPNCLISYLNCDQEAWGNEIRKVTAACINIGVNIEDIKSENEILKMNQAILKIQTICRTFQGFIYRTYLDDKGLNVFVILGSYPNSNQENAARGTLLGSLLVHDLTRLEIPVSIGIATGHVRFSTAGDYRKDLYIIGEPLYMAYLFMLITLKDSERKLLVDQDTKFEAEAKVSFIEYKNPVFLNKLNHKLYEPILSLGSLKPLPFNTFPDIRTHHYNMEYTSMNHQEDYVDAMFMVGRDMELVSRLDMMKKFLRTPFQANLLIIAGAYGVGKSLFARNLLEKTAETLENYNTGDRPLILTSSINPYTKMLKLNGWRNIMREILNIMAFQTNKRKEDLLFDILDREKELQANMSLVAEILDLKYEAGNPFSEKTIAEESLIVAEDAGIPNYEQKLILNIMMMIILQFLGFDDDNGPNFGESRPSRPPLIVCLDDMQHHDEMSWNLTNRILKRIKRIFIIGVVRSDDLESPEKTDMVEKGIRTIASNPEIIPDTCILNNLDYGGIELQIKRILEDRQPSDELTRFIIDRSEGNPLCAIDLLDNLLRQEILQSLNNEIFPNDLLKKFIRLNQFIEIMVPMSRYKINGSKLDQLEFTHYNLLKVASAIGTTFDLKTLVIANPFAYNLIPQKEILRLLNELRQLEVIDLVDDQSKNLVYKFNNNFIRETIYQRIPFALRRGLHRMIAESWQNADDPLENEFVLYQWNLSDPESDFQQNYTNSAKRAFFVRNINAIMAQATSKGEPTLKSGKLDRLSVKDKHAWTTRFAIVTPSSIKYYKTETDYREKPVFETASIPLKSITQITPIYRNEVYVSTERPGFKIKTSKWYKGPNENGPREFVFACDDDEEIENWQIHIEYARSRAIYDDFISNLDPRSISLRKSAPNSNIGSMTTSPRPGKDPKPSDRIKETGYVVSKDLTVGEKLGFQSIVNAAMSDRTPEKAFFKQGGTLMPKGSNKSKNKALVESFLNKGQVAFWSNLFTAPMNAGPGKNSFGKINELVKKRPDLLRVEQDMMFDDPNEYSVGSVKQQTYKPQYPRHVERGISDKLKRLGGGSDTFDTTGQPFDSHHKSSKKQSPDSRKSSLERETTTNVIRNRQQMTIFPYQRETDEAVETVIKNKRSKVGVRDEKKDNKLGKTSFSPFKKGKKNLNRPNIYGRYEYFPTFFIDAYLDDRAIRNLTNDITNVQEKMRMKKKKTLVNIPKTIQIRKDIKDGEQIYTLDEESYLRNRSGEVHLSPPRRLEDESHIYKPTNRSISDYPQDGYRLSPQRVSINDDRSLNYNKGSIPTLLTETSMGRPEQTNGPLLPHTLTSKSPLNIQKDFPLNYQLKKEEPVKSPYLPTFSPLVKEEFKLNTSPYQPSYVLKDDNKPSLSYALPDYSQTSPLKNLSPDYSVSRDIPSYSNPLDMTKYQPTVQKKPTTIIDETVKKYAPPTLSVGKPSQQQPKPTYPVSNPNPYDNYLPPTDRVYTKPFEVSDSRPQPTLLKPTSSIPTSLLPNNSLLQPTTQTNNLIPSSSYLPPSRGQPVDSRFSSFVPEPLKTQYVPEKKEPLRIQSPKKDVDPSQYFYLGHTIRPTRSQDGDDFAIDRGEFIIVTRIYEKRGLAELLWKGLTGLFPITDIEIIRKTDANELHKHVTIKPSSSQEYDSQATDNKYKIVYSESSEIRHSEDHYSNIDDSQAYTYNNDQLSIRDPDYSVQSDLDESMQSRISKTSGTKLPSKMAKRLQQKQKGGISSESVLGK